MQLTWRPSSASALYFLKEISSCGCLNTADVVYPAFPQVLYYSPELMRLMVLSHLEYAANMVRRRGGRASCVWGWRPRAARPSCTRTHARAHVRVCVLWVTVMAQTNQPYPLPFAPHHLGFWPIADLPYTQQENMPLEETAWDLLIIAAIAQRQGGDLTWLTPFWPLLQTWCAPARAHVGLQGLLANARVSSGDALCRAGTISSSRFSPSHRSSSPLTTSTACSTTRRTSR